MKRFILILLAVAISAAGCGRRDVVDGSSAENYHRSLAELMKSMPMAEQRAFVAAVGRLERSFYSERELAELADLPPHPEYLKLVHRKSAAEIGALAERVPDRKPELPKKPIQHLRATEQGKSEVSGGGL